MTFLGFDGAQPYKYSPIDPLSKTFRLIRLLEPKSSHIPFASGTIRIEIVETSVDSSLEYAALSYAWSVPPNVKTPDRRIIVETKDGAKELRIFRPLEVALTHLAASKAGSLLFVDQICINQRNNDEKTHQVQLMRDIYSGCNKVITWLGPATKDSDTYFDFLQEVCSEGVISGLLGPRLPSVMKVFDAVMDPTLAVTAAEKEDRDDVIDMLARYGDRFPIRGLSEVLDRLWFNRLWTIQEAVLSPRLSFVCGYKEVCFDCFRSGLMFYNFYNNYWLRGLDHAVSQVELKLRKGIFDKTLGFRRIFQERKALHQQNKQRSLYDIILKYNVNGSDLKIGATLAEDRLFGLLGLAPGDDHLRGSINVQYENVDRVFTDTAALMLEQNLDALLFSQFPKQVTNVPSWVPDWSMNLRVPHTYNEELKPESAAGGNQEESSSSSSRIQYDAETGRLRLRGVLVDRITRVGEREILVKMDPEVFEQVDYRSASLFFDEASSFVQENSGLLKPEHATEDALRQAHFRLCDSGLTIRQLTQDLGPSAAVEQYERYHSSIHKLGQNLLRSDATVKSYHITRILRTIGIAPWYWVPGSEFENLIRCAKNPVAAGRVIFEGLADFVVDMLGLAVASLRVTTYPYWLRLRHRFSNVQLRNPGAKDMLEQQGLNPEALSPGCSAFLENLLKNTKRRLFQTEKGFLGLAPKGSRVGDSLVVFLGGTTPHVIRKGPVGGVEEVVMWKYVGEAYCDGIMDGEAVSELKGVETFDMV